MVTRPVPAAWLSLRRGADHAAREASLPLVDELVGTLVRRDRARTEGTVPRPDETVEVRVVDAGAGTGSTLMWLAARLAPLPQHWILVDHDAELIGTTDLVAPPSISRLTRRIATVAELPDIVTGGAGPVVITCAALLDLLSPDDAAVLVDVIVQTGSAALLSLSVTGEVSIDPPHPADAPISAAFDAHQRRDDLLGPDAIDHVGALLRDRGHRVRVMQTPWRLDAADQSALLARYLADRGAVAVEQDPALTDLVAVWGAARQEQIRRGNLVVRVGHADILSLPPNG